jgi:hypothetical protein
VICLRLDPLFVDREEEDSVAFKQEFEMPDKDLGGPVHEFLYLNHPEGTSQKRWSWGPVGQVNGALLWPEALAYFMRRIVISGGVPADLELKSSSPRRVTRSDRRKSAKHRKGE